MRSFFYRFRNTPADAGLGVDNLALERPMPVPADSLYCPRYMVRGQLSPQAPGYVKIRQSVLPVSLAGNGSGLHGQFALVALAELQKGNKG
jgi:hypothetical protein